MAIDHIKNNNSKVAKELCTLVVLGYDSKGKSIEVAISRVVNIAKGFTTNMSALLSQSKVVQMTTGYCNTVSLQLKSGLTIQKIKYEIVVAGVKKEVVPAYR